MLGRELDDETAMNQGCRLRKHNQAAIRRVCKCGDAALNLFASCTTDRTYLYPERRRRALDGAKLANPSGICRVSKHRHPCPTNAVITAIDRS